jgi:hypothetical protein
VLAITANQADGVSLHGRQWNVEAWPERHACDICFLRNCAITLPCQIHVLASMLCRRRALAPHIFDEGGHPMTEHILIPLPGLGTLSLPPEVFEEHLIKPSTATAKSPSELVDADELQARAGIRWLHSWRRVETKWKQEARRSSLRELRKVRKSLKWRRGRDSNPGTPVRMLLEFQSSAFDRSATSPAGAKVTRRDCR